MDHEKLKAYKAQARKNYSKFVEMVAIFERFLKKNNYAYAKHKSSTTKSIYFHVKIKQPEYEDNKNKFAAIRFSDHDLPNVYRLQHPVDFFCQTNKPQWKKSVKRIQKFIKENGVENRESEL